MVLRNPQHERFAQAVVSGKSPVEAYVAAGYQEKTAYTCGPRLLKRPEVRARVDELQQRVSETVVERAVLSQEFVLGELMDNVLKAKQERQFSAVNRALELLGKELGMFADRSHLSVEWDGDLKKLTGPQLEKMAEQMEEQIAKDDPKRAAELRTKRLAIVNGAGTPNLAGPVQ